MTYRILSVCGALGYGFDEHSLNEAMKDKLDIVGSDAGSMDPGPYYLGSGTSYFEHPQLKRDFSLMLKAALKQKCPLILGSCGLSGDDPHLEYMLNIVKETLVEQNVKNIKVAVISGHVDADLLIGQINKLTPLGRMPSLTKEMIKKSALVGQMGIAPFITALEEGAQIILCGRSCDVAIFAADAVRRGIDPGLAFHAAHILECGAVACDPGSASDCLVAEFDEKNNSVIFISPNRNRRTLIKSIAAHSLYEESHPGLQYYPEGVLSFEYCQYFQQRPEIAGVSGSVFVHMPLSIKLEGSLWLGKRWVSLLFCKKDQLAHIPNQLLVYGRNGVQDVPLKEDENELGILIKATAKNADDAKALSSMIKGYMLHFGYPGRRSTAGNIAFPLSPQAIQLQEQNQYTSIVIAGTRDPLFISRFEEIKQSVIDLAKEDFPELFNRCKLDIIKITRDNPLLLLETIAKDNKTALKNHEEELAKLKNFIDTSAQSYIKLSTDDAYQWSVYHLLHDAQLIKEKLFPIKFYNVKGEHWELINQMQPRYTDIGLTEFQGDIDPNSLMVIKPVATPSKPNAFKPLTEMAAIIRSKDAGVNVITFDILFNTTEDYQQALRSNFFTRKNMSKVLNKEFNNVINCYRVDACNAIKISVYRKKISGSPGSHDVFGAQQQMDLVISDIPYNFSGGPGLQPGG